MPRQKSERLVCTLCGEIGYVRIGGRHWLFELLKAPQTFQLTSRGESITVELPAGARVCKEHTAHGVAWVSSIKEALARIEARKEWLSSQE